MWDTVIINPLINGLIWFYGLVGHNYVLAILIVTALIRLALLPLTIQQQKSTLAMQELQPKLKKIQEKHKDDPETLQRKTMELYREAGATPFGGCLLTLIQLPILIGLYRAITRSLAASPLQLIDLSQHIYQTIPAWLSWLPSPTTLIPLNSRFWWLDLAAPDPTPIIPILVFITTWLQQKLLTPPTTAGADSQQAAMTRSMQITMPLMISFFALSFPAGLSIYWIVSNFIGVVQYAAMGRASLKNLFGTEDGSFSLEGLLGLPAPEGADAKSGTRSSGRAKSRKRKK